MQNGWVDFDYEQGRQLLVGLVWESPGYPKNARCLGEPPDKLFGISIGLELDRKLDAASSYALCVLNHLLILLRSAGQVNPHQVRVCSLRHPWQGFWQRWPSSDLQPACSKFQDLPQ
jgi:hypothetical protein